MAQTDHRLSLVNTVLTIMLSFKIVLSEFRDPETLKPNKREANLAGDRTL